MTFDDFPVGLLQLCLREFDSHQSATAEGRRCSRWGAAPWQCHPLSDARFDWGWAEYFGSDVSRQQCSIRLQAERRDERFVYRWIPNREDARSLVENAIAQVNGTDDAVPRQLWMLGAGGRFSHGEHTVRISCTESDTNIRDFQAPTVRVTLIFRRDWLLLEDFRAVAKVCVKVAPDKIVAMAGYLEELRQEADELITVTLRLSPDGMENGAFSVPTHDRFARNGSFGVRRYESLGFEGRRFELSEIRRFNEPDSANRPTPCQGCTSYHGKTYNGVQLICAIHPSGVDGDSCGDWESIAPDSNPVTTP